MSSIWIIGFLKLNPFKNVCWQKKTERISSSGALRLIMRRLRNRNGLSKLKEKLTKSWMLQKYQKDTVVQIYLECISLLRILREISLTDGRDVWRIWLRGKFEFILNLSLWTEYSDCLATKMRYWEKLI